MSYDSIQYNRFYYNNLCHVCKESNQNLKRCSVCKTVAYCSRDHQKQDWKFHKDLCKAIAKVDEILKYSTISTFEDFRKYNVSKSILWHKELCRKLDDFECQMWMFPRVCAKCFSRKVIIDCPNCLNVSYCSEQHKNDHEKQHSEFCGALKLCMDIDLYNFHEKYSTPKIAVHDFEPEVNILPNNLQELMRMYEKCSVPKENNSKKFIKFIIRSNVIAPAATILYGMEESGLLTNRFLNKPDLTVHIVGAALTEMAWFWKLITELPFHWIKDLKSLNFYVIGPEIRHEGVRKKFTQQLCDSCKAKNPSSKIVFCWKLYHEVAESIDKPDIVVVFNSGLHEFGDNPWDPSIDCLTMYSNVPLLLTAYTLNEIKQDICTLISKSSHKVNVVLEPQKNPFSNMTPVRDWETENSPVFYVNGYLAILKAE
ncbi:uncharacterized protein LOC108917575 [Anoplophora glabripennis]|uniref:uncharacterized protein LOC108917575 n=1 Tax=Anoplophora glabripennis TaxID=217634 RepID=UPI00087466E5|nr:uncharacterized protein LOC108917575 [Anoplophora glabripennis]